MLSCERKDKLRFAHLFFSKKMEIVKKIFEDMIDDITNEPHKEPDQQSHKEPPQQSHDNSHKNQPQQSDQDKEDSIKLTCAGCSDFAVKLYGYGGHPSQRKHMGLGGCLSTPTV